MKTCRNGHLRTPDTVIEKFRDGKVMKLCKVCYEANLERKRAKQKQLREVNRNRPRPAKAKRAMSDLESEALLARLIDAENVPAWEKKRRMWG